MITMMFNIPWFMILCSIKVMLWSWLHIFIFYFIYILHMHIYYVMKSCYLYHFVLYILMVYLSSSLHFLIPKVSFMNWEEEAMIKILKCYYLKKYYVLNLWYPCYGYICFFNVMYLISKLLEHKILGMLCHIL